MHLWCSDGIDDDEDMRYILVAADNTLGHESVDQLIAVDKQFGFSTDLFKLPNKLQQVNKEGYI